MRGLNQIHKVVILLIGGAFLFAMLSQDSLSDYSDSLFFSPPRRSPTDDPLTWILPSGGEFTSPDCPGVEVSFPEGFLESRVNVHCNPTELQMKLGVGQLDIGQRFFFGVWSGWGEETKFQHPLLFRIPYQEEKDGKRVIPKGTEDALSLCLWNEETGIWHCLSSDIDEETNYVTAEVDTLLPTRYIQGWEGRSLMAILIQASEPTPTRMATTTPTTTSSPTLAPTPTSSPVSTSSPTFTPVPSPSPSPTYVSTEESPTVSPTHPSPSPTDTPTVSSPTPTVTFTSTAKPSPSASPSPIPTPPEPSSLCGSSLALGLLLGIGVAAFRSRAG